MVEFALLLPLLAGLFVLLINVENAISTAIVGQKYTRSQTHFLFFNHRYYPESAFLGREDKRIQGAFWMGVSGRNHYNEQIPKPIAPTIRIGFGKTKIAEDEEAQAEFSQESQTLTKRHLVRIRSLTFTCVPPLGPQENQYYTEGNLQETSYLGGNMAYCSP
jgi:hypothetical protein